MVKPSLSRRFWFASTLIWASSLIISAAVFFFLAEGFDEESFVASLSSKPAVC